MTVAEAGCGLKEGHNARSQSATQSGGNIQPHHFVRRPLSTLLGPSGSCGQDHVLLDKRVVMRKRRAAAFRSTALCEGDDFHRAVSDSDRQVA
jgi:hypothetical protein